MHCSHSLIHTCCTFHTLLCTFPCSDERPAPGGPDAVSHHGGLGAGPGERRTQRPRHAVRGAMHGATQDQVGVELCTCGANKDGMN